MNEQHETPKIYLGYLNHVSSAKLRAIMLHQGEQDPRHQINLIIDSLHTALGLDGKRQ
jgi:hypothetical protein